jgi:hypothetical protein
LIYEAVLDAAVSKESDDIYPIVPSPAVVDTRFDPVIPLYTFMALRKVSDDRYKFPSPCTLDTSCGVEIYPLVPRFLTMYTSWPAIVLAETTGIGALLYTFDAPDTTKVEIITLDMVDCRKRDDM